VSDLASIRVRIEIYSELKRLKLELERMLGSPVSIDEVLRRLLDSRKLRPSDFQGTWKMTHKEAEELLKSLRLNWSGWRYPNNELRLERKRDKENV